MWCPNVVGPPVSDPTITDLRVHVQGQIDAQVSRAGDKRAAAVILALLDDTGVIDVAGLLEIAHEQLALSLIAAPGGKDTALLAGLAFMAGEDATAASEALHRVVGEDLSHELRSAVGDAVTRLDGVLQAVGHLQRTLRDDVLMNPALGPALLQIKEGGESLRAGAILAISHGVNVPLATRIVSFLELAPPAFPLGPTLADQLLQQAAAAWKSMYFAHSKALLDRVLGRDVLHEERDGVVRLLGLMESRIVPPLSWAREARRELFVVTIAKLAAVPVTDARQLLDLFHRCCPVGVASRDRSELLGLQATWNACDARVVELADEALEDLDARKYAVLAARYGVSVAFLKSARAQLERFESSPVSRLVLGLDPESTDLVFERKGSELVLTGGMMGSLPAEPTDELFAVAQAILDKSGEFMRYGSAHLVPIALAEAAHAAELTQGQVLRVTENVLVETPWGIMALNHFIRQ